MSSSFECIWLKRTDLERCLQIIAVALCHVLHRASLLRSLKCLAGLFQMTHILQVSRLATSGNGSLIDTSQNDSGTMLSSAMVSCMKRGDDTILAATLSRMKDCVPLGNTGYPLLLAMNVDDGR